MLQNLGLDWRKNGQRIIGCAEIHRSIRNSGFVFDLPVHETGQGFCQKERHSTLGTGKHPGKDLLDVVAYLTNNQVSRHALYKHFGLINFVFLVPPSRSGLLLLDFEKGYQVLK